MTRMVVVVTHIVNSLRILRAVVLPNNLVHLLQEVKILTPLMVATTITWRCGMPPWLNNSNKVQVSRPDRQAHDDDRDDGDRHDLTRAV
jgi:hypothetical protein